MGQRRGNPPPWTRLRVRAFRWRCRDHVVSFPKSGRTWTKGVLERYAERLAGVAPGSIDFATWTPFLPIGAWGLVPGLVFSHGIYLSDSNAELRRHIRRQISRRVLLQVRDPRDVLLTYYFQRVRRPRGHAAVVSDLATFLRDDRFGIRRIVDYMNLWYDARESYRGFHLLRYEDAQADPVAGFADALRFLHWPVDEDMLRDVVASVADTTRDVEVGGFPALDAARRGDGEVALRTGGPEKPLLPRHEDVLSRHDLQYLEEQAQKAHPALGYTERHLPR